MIRRRPNPLQLVPLLLAVGLLFGLPKIPLLVTFEQLVFPGLERFQPDLYFLEEGDAADFEVEVLHFAPDESHPANIGTYLIDEETREIMGPNDGDAVEWAQFLRQTRLADDRLIVITSSLSWPDATELPLRALQEQVDLTPTLVVGLRAELLNRPSPLPPELENSVIPTPLPAGLIPPEIDHLNAPPSVTAPLFGISEVRGLKIEQEGKSIRVPLLVHWGDHLLPTLQLASLLTAHHLQPADLIIEPEGYLRLGEDGPILRIDPTGSTWLDQSPVEPQSASQLQIYPGQAETIKIILPQEPPLQAAHLASQLDQALSQAPRLFKTYHRWPLAIEITALALLLLLLNTKRFWLFLPLVFLLPALSPFFSRWFLAGPLILLVGAALSLRIVLPKPKKR